MTLNPFANVNVHRIWSSRNHGNPPPLVGLVGRTIPNISRFREDRSSCALNVFVLRRMAGRCEQRRTSHSGCAAASVCTHTTTHSSRMKAFGPATESTEPRPSLMLVARGRIWGGYLGSAIGLETHYRDHPIVDGSGHIELQRPVAVHFEHDAGLVYARFLSRSCLYGPHIVHHRHRGHVGTDRQHDAGQRLAGP